MNADENTAALVGGGESHCAEGALAIGYAFFWRLQAMIDGIADHVNEGVREFFNDVAVEFGFLTIEYQLDLFFLLGRNIANESSHFLESGANGNHSERHGVALKL